MDIFVNNIGGTIPNVLSSLSNLQFWDMEDNFVEGPAFVNMTGLVSLNTYRVSFNRLTGQIPQDGLKDLSSLRELWLAANTLSGTIPDSIGNLVGLGKDKTSDYI